MNILRLDPAIPMTTPKGKAYAHFLNDCGDERDVIWGCFQDNGEIWWWPNSKVRVCNNISLGRENVEIGNL